MRAIVLQNGGATIVDDEDYLRYHSYPWHVLGDYVCCTWEGQRLRLHRLIMNAPADMEVQHRDLDPLNNTRGNLELLSVPDHRAAHGGQPRRQKRRGPPPVEIIRVEDAPFDWDAVDRDYRARGL